MSVPMIHEASRAAAVVLAVALMIAGCTTAGDGPTPSPSGSDVSPTPSPAATPSALPPTPSPVPTSVPTVDPFLGQPLAAQVDAACGPAAPVLVTNRVRATPEGVRFVVNGEAGWSLLMYHPSTGGSDSVWLESGFADTTLFVPPGDYDLSCADPALSGPAPVTSLRIEDPDKVYRTMEIATYSNCVAGGNSFEEGTLGEMRDPIELARTAIDVAPGDVVEPGGYPAETGRARIVRASEVIGWVDLSSDGHGGWRIGGWNLCHGLSFSD